MYKEEIRKHFRQKRDVLPQQLREGLNSKIKKRLLEVIVGTVSNAHIYLPINSKNEVDTWPIIHQFWEHNIGVAVPVMHHDLMTSCCLTTDTEIKENRWGVPEPVKKIAFEDRKIEAVIVPLLAFGPEGYRIGYGKGYYDKFLVTLDEDVTKIGLSFFPPVDEITDIDDWDIPLDICITPDAVYQF